MACQTLAVTLGVCVCACSVTHVRPLWCRKLCVEAMAHTLDVCRQAGEKRRFSRACVVFALWVAVLGRMQGVGECKALSAAGCKTDEDCSLLGVCESTWCLCDSGWTGDDCGECTGKCGCDKAVIDE